MLLKKIMDIIEATDSSFNYLDEFIPANDNLLQFSSYEFCRALL